MSSHDWVELGTTAELSGRQLQTLTVRRTRIALSYRDGRFSAISGVCNHAGGPLGDGRLEGDYCDTHSLGIGEQSVFQDG
jgi:nitrite reductase/ring-hydroxylating ferredoxin subunit